MIGTLLIQTYGELSYNPLLLRRVLDPADSAGIARDGFDRLGLLTLIRQPHCHAENCITQLCLLLAHVRPLKFRRKKSHQPASAVR